VVEGGVVLGCVRLEGWTDPGNSTHKRVVNNDEHTMAAWFGGILVPIGIGIWAETSDPARTGSSLPSYR
jgi:hypothetical protein